MTDRGGFRQQLKLLLIDKAVIGFFLLIVGLWFNSYWNERQEVNQARQHEEQLQLQRTSLTGNLLPSITDPEMDVNFRANLLSLLNDADVVKPQIVARIGQTLLEDDVNGAVFENAIKRSMLLDVSPFLEVAEPVVRSVRLRNIIADPIADADDLLSKWQSAFEIYLDDSAKNEPALTQLSSAEFFVEKDYGVLSTGRLHTLAFLMSPQMLLGMSTYSNNKKIKTLTESRIISFQYIGHSAVVVRDANIINSSEYPTAYNFIENRLLRDTNNEIDVKLLYEEIRILSDSKNVFGMPLRGKIAIPLAMLFTNSKWDGIRNQAGQALASMLDCGVAAEPILANYVIELTDDIKQVEGIIGQRMWLRKYANHIATLFELTSNNTQVLADALVSLQKIRVIKESQIPDFRIRTEQLLTCN